MEKIRIGKARLDNVTMEECLEKIRESLRRGIKGFIATVNVDHIMILERDAEFRFVHESAQMVLADGMPIIWASHLLRTPLKEKVSGSDLVLEICRLAAAEDFSLFFLGAAESVALKAAERLRKIWPNLRIVGTYSPPFGFEKNSEENQKIIRMINKAKPDILLAAFGAPKQEKWMHRHLENLDVTLALGIGASLDFVAGTKKRAPVFLQKIGAEWFWRFLQEPRRLFKRYFIYDMLPFMVLVLKQILAKCDKSTRTTVR